MHLETDLIPSHTGTERYGVIIAIKDPGDVYDVVGQRVQYVIRPELVILAWERRHRGRVFTPWKRRVFGVDTASRITGWRVLKDGLSNKQQAYVPVFYDEDPGGRLTEYALRLPGLLEAVNELEAKLPQ